MIVQGFTALMSASYNGHREIVRLLLEAGANRNQYQTEVRRIYLLKGHHVGCATGQNRFVFCVQLWKMDVAEMLIAQGADTTLVDKVTQ
jgi:ankyrin repeat protein